VTVSLVPQSSFVITRFEPKYGACRAAGASSEISPEVMLMDEVEVNRLCEELNTLIELESGFNPDALSRARWAITALKSTESGDYIDKKLVALAAEFEQWFSIDKWKRQDDGGQLVKRCLEDNLICMRAAMWRKFRG
jgi:hypothetical protein